MFLKRTFIVENEKIILFKFNNNHIQVKQADLPKTLLVTADELVLITLSNGAEVQKYVCPKDKYDECPDKDLIHLYLKFKKISSQLAKK